MVLRNRIDARSLSPDNLSNELSTDRSLSVPRQALFFLGRTGRAPTVRNGRWDEGEVCRITSLPGFDSPTLLSKNTARMGDEGKAVRRRERRRLCCLERKWNLVLSITDRAHPGHRLQLLAPVPGCQRKLSPDSHLVGAFLRGWPVLPRRRFCIAAITALYRRRHVVA